MAKQPRWKAGRKKPEATTATGLASRSAEVMADDVAEVVKLMVGGLPESEILLQIRKSLPDLNPDAVLQAAVNHFLAVGTIKHEGLVATFGWCLEATKETYRKLLASADYVGALRAIKQIKELADQAATLYRSPDEPEPES